MAQNLCGGWWKTPFLKHTMQKLNAEHATVSLAMTGPVLGRLEDLADEPPAAILPAASSERSTALVVGTRFVEKPNLTLEERGPEKGKGETECECKA